MAEITPQKWNITRNKIDKREWQKYYTRCLTEGQLLVTETLLEYEE